MTSLHSLIPFRLSPKVYYNGKEESVELSINVCNALV